MIFKKCLVGILAAALAVSSLPTMVFAQGEADTVTLFTTNDVHGVVQSGDGVIGMALASAIAESTPNSLLIDAGDATQGAAFATPSLGEDVIKVMNAAGYDVMAAGNHEFDYGLDQLMANAETADFPIISANVLKDGEPLLESSAIIEEGGHKIGFIGVTTASTATSTNPSKLGGVTFADEITSVKAEIAEISADVDTIVIVGHIGNNSSAVKCTSEQLLAGLSDEELSKVSAFIDGHSHTDEQTAYERDGKSVAIVQTGTRFTKLGKVELTFNDDGVTATAELIDAEAAGAYQLTEDGKSRLDSVNAYIAEIAGAQDEINSQVLCENIIPLWGGYVYYDYAEPRAFETNFGDFVCDAFLRYGEEFADNEGIELPVVGVENGGGISATLPNGKITKGDVLSAFNHGNTVVVLKVSPAEIYAAVEAGLTMTGQDDTGLLIRERVSGSFLQTSGMGYAFDPSAESGSKVTRLALFDKLTFNIKDLDRNDTEHKILLVTNEYVAGSSFDINDKIGELGGEDYLIESYILEQTENGTKPLCVPTDGQLIGVGPTVDKTTNLEKFSVTIPVYDAATLGTTPGATIKEDSVTLPNRVVHIRIDNEEPNEYVTDENGCVTVKLPYSGMFTLFLEESADDMPVYVNVYSGAGTYYTKEGYYRLGFAAPADLPEYVPAPSAVTGLKLADCTASSLRLAWDKNTSADGYIIEMKDGDVWKRVGKLKDNTAVEFNKYQLKAGTAYTFRVMAYKMNGETALYSEYTTISACTDPSVITGLKLKARAADALRLTWDKNTSADGYIIEMKDGDSWKRVGKITDNSTVEFKKSKLSAGTAYTFRVKAYKMDGKTALYGATKTISVRTNPSVITGLKLKARAADALRLTWDKNTSADGYIIEMKDGDSRKRVGKITDNSTVEFKKSKLSAGTAYTFRVKAYKMSGKTALYGATKTISVRTNPSVITGLNLKASAKDAIRLTWDKNASADGYIIEMKDGDSRKRVGKITDNSTVEFKKSKLSAGTAYTFRVKAYKMSGKTALYGATKTITVKTK